MLMLPAPLSSLYILFFSIMIFVFWILLSLKSTCFLFCNSFIFSHIAAIFIFYRFWLSELLIQIFPFSLLVLRMFFFFLLSYIMRHSACYLLSFITSRISPVIHFFFPFFISEDFVCCCQYFFFESLTCSKV